jgi:hypothetical protein
MTKVVYNACYGGFGLSDAAKELYLKYSGVSYTSKEDEFSSLTGKTFYVDGEYISLHEIGRADPILIRVIEELGEAANVSYSQLTIVDVPEGERYRIDEYDGSESVMTVSDYNWETA